MDNKKKNTKSVWIYTFCVLVFAGYAGGYVWLRYNDLPGTPVAVIRAAMYLAIPALAAFTAIVAWLFAERSYKRVMFFLAVATALILSGETIWIMQFIARSGAGPIRVGLGNYLVSAGYLFLWVLLLSMASFQNLRSEMNLRRLVDIYLYFLFTTILVWNISFRYIFLRSDSFSNLQNLIVTLAPVLNLALVFGIAANTVGFKRGRWRPWEVCITLGASSLIAADIGFTYLSVRGAYTQTNPVALLTDIGWMAGSFMFFLAGASYLAARDKSLHKIDEVREAPLVSRLRELLVYASILGTMLLLLPLAFMDNPAAYDTWIILICSSMLLLLVILRAFLYVSASNKLILTSLTDLLTGVNNYRYLQTKLDAELSRAKRYDENLSVALIDLNRFSEVNKARGHAMGDAILKSFARVLRKHLRLSDSVCRIGGDEFAIILPRTSADAALTACARIKETLKDENHSAISVFLNGFCCGISSFPDHGQDRQTLLDNAEMALQWAETNGRDQVFIYTAKKAGKAGKKKKTKKDGGKDAKN